jgi:pimeloyl-ACP methyl ester carboxylesterase
LRYDDRGTGKSTGKFDSATTYDFASDAAAAVSFLQYRDEIDPRRVGAIGHSEGGLIVEILGASPDAPAFLVSMAGPSLTGEEILILQTALISKANGEKESDIEANEKLERDIYSIIKKNNDDAKATYKIKQTLTAFNNRMKGTEGYEPLDSTVMNARIQTLISPWFRTFLTLDPIEYIRKIKCPVLVINGSLDLQVPADENLAGWEKGLIFAGNSKYSIEKVEGVNHLFQHAQTGSPNEYSNIEETISPEVLTIIGNWILQTTGKK